MVFRKRLLRDAAFLCQSNCYLIAGCHQVLLRARVESIVVLPEPNFGFGSLLNLRVRTNDKKTHTESLMMKLTLRLLISLI